MIKIFSGIRDWNFAGQVEDWLHELGSDYEVYDCKLTSAYNSDASEIYVTAIFFYTRIAVSLKDAGEVEVEVKKNDPWARYFSEVGKSWKDSKLDENVNKKNVTKTEEVDWVDLLNRLSEVIRDSSVDLSEPYASGRRKR